MKTIRVVSAQFQQIFSMLQRLIKIGILGVEPGPKALTTARDELTKVAATQTEIAPHQSSNQLSDQGLLNRFKTGHLCPTPYLLSRQAIQPV